MEKARKRTRGLLLLVVCAAALVVTAVALAWPEQHSAPRNERKPAPKPVAEQPLPGGGGSQAGIPTAA